MKNERRLPFKQIAVKITLLAIFLFLMIVLMMPLVAEYQFNSAQKLASSYLWQKAEIKFKKSLALDPFNATHFSGYAEFLRSVGPFWEKKASLLYEPGEFYLRAYRLAPMSAGYPLRIAEIKLKLFLKDKERYQKELKESLNYFKIEMENDPNGFNTSYEAGYWLVEAWQDLPEDYKQLAIDRLTYVISRKPWYWEYIYPWVWQYTNNFKILERLAPGDVGGQEDLLCFLESNNLYQFRSEVADAVKRYMKRDKPAQYAKREQERLKEIESIKKNAAPAASVKDSIAVENWHGYSEHGKNEYKDGSMYWTGTMSGILNIPQGRSELVIQAKGSPADGIYPYMLVELDGKEVGGAFVDSVDWKEYAFEFSNEGGPKVLSITFCNDGGNEEKHEDRNLYIGKAIIKNGLLRPFGARNDTNLDSNNER